MGEIVPTREIARELVIAPPADHKFDFIVRLKGFEILDVESVTLARVRALYVYDLYDTCRNPLQWPFSTGFKQDLVPRLTHSLHQWNQFALLQHWLASSDLNQSGSRAQAFDLIEHLPGCDFFPDSKTLLTIAPHAAQI